MDGIYSVLKKVRLENGLTQQEVADRLSIVVSAYGKVERGSCHLTIERLRELAELYNLPVEYFLSSDPKS